MTYGESFYYLKDFQIRSDNYQKLKQPKMQTIQNAVIGTLEAVKDQIESRDVDVLDRQRIFAEE